MTIKQVLLSICCLWSSTTLAQTIDYSDEFLAKMDAVGISLSTPVDTDYKDIAVLKKVFQTYDFAIKSKKEKLEIRYFIEAYDEADPTFAVPHLRFTRFLMNLGSNEEEHIMAVHDVDVRDLEEEFQADWGKITFFRPKKSFSSATHCKLLSLFKEGQGMVYVLFLFDEVSEDLDRRFYAVQFQ